MSKDAQETVTETAVAATAPPPASRPSSQSKKPSSTAKPRRAPATAPREKLPSWWPKSGIVAVEGCLVVRLDPARYAEIVGTEKEMGVSISQLAGGAVAEAVRYLSDEVAREAERLRPIIESIDAEDRELFDELNRRKAARLERAKELLARTGTEGLPS